MSVFTQEEGIEDVSIIISLLAQAGIDYRDKKEEVMVDCPFCEENGRTPDTHQCLGINRYKFLAHCLRCGWAANGLTSIVKALSRKFDVPFSYRELMKEMQTDYAPITPQPKELALPDGYEQFHSQPQDSYERRARLYLKKRGIDKIDIAAYRIGFAATGEQAGRVVFPVIDADRKIYGYVGRAFIADLKPKYLNSSGVKILWGANKGADIGVLVEGLMDAIAVTRALRSQGATGLSTLGCGLEGRALEQLRRYREVVSMPDWDESGVQEARIVCSRASEMALQASVCIPWRLDGSDPDSWPQGRIQKLLTERVPWSKAAEWRLRRVRRVAAAI